MARSQTEDEVRAAKIEAMGQDLGELHFLLWKDVTWMHFEWHEYRVLFGGDATRIALMNKTAPRFFWSLDRVLWQDILLSLSRLDDPPGTGGQRNLTFRGLLKHVRPSLRGKLESGLDAYEAKVSFARDWRHRRYAHRDHDHVASPATNPLKRASREQVEGGLEAARAVMNLVELEYQDSTTAYDSGGASISGAESLLYFLDSGAEADDGRRAKHELWRPRYR